jgi:GntR family transcriptional regulator
VLSRASPVPLYRQVRHEIVRRIDDGRLVPGEMTTEQELSAEYGVSRITIRQALAELAREGRVLRVPGKGTFVADRPKLEPQSALTSFSENMEALGRRPSYRSIRVAEVPAAESVARALAVAPDAPVLRIERLLLADGIPMAVMRAHLPERTYGRDRALFSVERLARESLYRTLERDLSIQLWKARETVEAATADDDAEPLGLAPDDLLLVVHRHTLDRDANPVEYTQLRYRADLYRYQVELYRHGQDARRTTLPADEDHRRNL